MSEENQETTYQVTYQPTGRVWTMRPVPRHLFIMFGQMPTSLTEAAAEALDKENIEAFEQEMAGKLSPEEERQSMIFAREIVDYAVVHPKITLTPRNKDEISPFKISEHEFIFLVKSASSGGLAAGLNSFRTQSGQATGSGSNGKKSGKKRK
jgi:hypothetical protein